MKNEKKKALKFNSYYYYKFVQIIVIDNSSSRICTPAEGDISCLVYCCVPETYDVRGFTTITLQNKVCKLYLLILQIELSFGIVQYVDLLSIY